MHMKSRELESNGVCNKTIYKEALAAKMLNLILSLFDLFHSFKFCTWPAEKKFIILGLEKMSSKYTGTHAVKKIG